MTEDRADHLEENRAGPATSPLLRPGMGQTNCKYKCVGPGRVRMNLSVNSARISIWTSSKQQNCPSLHQSPHLCPPCQATYGLLEETVKVGITFRMSGCFGALTLSVCLSFPFLFPPQWKHNFPLSLSFPYCWITGPFYSSLGQWYGNASSWGYAMWDAGQAGTKHRKKARVVISSEQKLTSKEDIGED